MRRKIDIVWLASEFATDHGVEFYDFDLFRTDGDKPRNGKLLKFLANSWDEEERLNELRNEFNSLVDSYSNVRVYEGKQEYRGEPEQDRVGWMVCVFDRGFRKKAEQLARHTYRIREL